MGYTAQMPQHQAGMFQCNREPRGLKSQIRTTPQKLINIAAIIACDAAVLLQQEWGNIKSEAMLRR